MSNFGTPVSIDIVRRHVIIKLNYPFQSDAERQAVTICGGTKREKHVYTSRSNRIEIRIVGQNGIDKKRFALKYHGKKNIRNNWYFFLSGQQ